MVRTLQPNMMYQFHVIAQNARGTSAPSEVLQVTTQREVCMQIFEKSIRYCAAYNILFRAIF